jgi:hypothetical protein
MHFDPSATLNQSAETVVASGSCSQTQFVMSDVSVVYRRRTSLRLAKRLRTLARRPRIP